MPLQQKEGAKCFALLSHTKTQAMRNFDNWKAEELEMTFGVQQVKNHPTLTNWLSAKVTPTQRELDTLLELQQILQENADAWNEDEVKFYFIGPLITLVNYQGPNYRPFNQRMLSGKLTDLSGQEIELGGKPDMMVAMGKEDPRQPFFFLHEYKPEKKRDTDPKGQLLSAMMVAQEKNGAPSVPIFGCYVLSRMWFFVVLEGNEWSRSLAYDATLPALLDIFSILREASRQIAQRAAAMPKPVLRAAARST
jgi:hypothetical protein